jgi:hypothetical protein
MWLAAQGICARKSHFVPSSLLTQFFSVHVLQQAKHGEPHADKLPYVLREDAAWDDLLLDEVEELLRSDREEMSLDARRT